jgi:hypothetical protein
VLSVLLRFTDSDDPFGIFKLFLVQELFNKSGGVNLVFMGPNLPSLIKSTNAQITIYKTIHIKLRPGI